jgi:hypothetical protein
MSIHQPLSSPKMEFETGYSPEFLNPKELHELPKLSNLAEGSIFLISFSISPRTLFISF